MRLGFHVNAVWMSRSENPSPVLSSRLCLASGSGSKRDGNVENGVERFEPDPAAAIIADWYSLEDGRDRVGPER